MTTLEAKTLQGILDSDYQDDVQPIGVPVWTFDIWGDILPDQRGGVLASLSKKGWADVRTDPKHPDEETTAITGEGLYALLRHLTQEAS